MLGLLSASAIRRELIPDSLLRYFNACGPKTKDDLLVPFELALALRRDGWYVRSSIIWAKRAPMPESVTDRPTSAHEHVFLLTKNKTYFYDADAVREEAIQEGRAESFYRPSRGDRAALYGGKGIGGEGDPDRIAVTNGRNLRNVWTLSPEPYPDAHFATFPTEIPRRCIKAGTSEKGCCAACGAPWRRVVEQERGGPTRRGDRIEAGGRMVPAVAFMGGGNATGRVPGSDTRGMPSLTSVTTGWEPSCACGAAVVPCVVLDPFAGSGTTGEVADELGRDSILIELNPEYAAMAERRIKGACPMFAAVEVA